MSKPSNASPQGERPWHRHWRAFCRSRLALVGLVLLVLLVGTAALAPWVSPQDPYDLAKLSMLDARQPPGSAWAEAPHRRFVLGSDGQGRDMVSAILFGLRTSVSVGVASTLLALSLGSALGLLAGYHGGRVDALIMRVVDLQLSFPPILVALILLAVSGPGVGKIIVALAAVQWAFYARTVRGSALVERTKEYIEAAVLQGLSRRRILLRHLLPNCMPPIIVVSALQVASAIALEATLSFLGLGLPITAPSLGLLIANGFETMLSGQYWISVFPGTALMLLIVSINLVADRLRDVLNPRLQAH